MSTLTPSTWIDSLSDAELAMWCNRLLEMSLDAQRDLHDASNCLTLYSLLFAAKGDREMKAARQQVRTA
jgi:hypothetical protein